MSVTQPKLTHPETSQEVSIKISAAAAAKTWEILKEMDDPDLKLRLLVSGGGCHGLTYDIQLSETVNPDDTIITAPVPNQVPVQYVSWVINAPSLSRLQGVEIDYESDPKSTDERFVLRNLRAQTQCSCGSSFSLEEGDPLPCQQ